MFASPLIQNNAFLRKSAICLMQVPRSIRRLAANPSAYLQHPPILCNSFPKSGTHLLVQVLEALPGVQQLGTFLASIPSRPFRQRPNAVMLRKLRRLIPGELATAHLYYKLPYAETLRRLHVVHYFIYRDLRDVAISEAHYLAKMNRWHQLHRYYNNMSTDAERIAWAITGESDPLFPFEYPDIGRRFASYRGWLDSDEVCAVRFEDLIGKEREHQIRRIVAYYLKCSKVTDNIDAVVAGAIRRINPSRSRTFREGKQGGWQQVFGEKHRSLMKQTAGSVLVDLGYEQDEHW